MIPKKFEAIEYSDLEALLKNEVAESKTLEYKREISSNEKLLAGVSALANSSGGDFVIGIEAKEGIPINLKGVVIKNADDEILRLEQILQNGLEPRLPSKNIKHIQSPNSEDFFLIRVSQSWIAPHRVKCKDKEFNDKFYGRHSGGKYPMDVSELRTAFMLSEQISERIRNFRLERIRKIKEDDELPVELIDKGKLVLHLIPLSAFSNSFNIDVSSSRGIWQTLNPIGVSDSYRMVNLDGVVSYYPSQDGNTNKYQSYTQLFRNGIIEAVCSLDFMRDCIIPSEHYEQQSVWSVQKYLKFLFYLGIEPPVYVFLSFANVKGYRLMVINPQVSGDNGTFVNRQDILLPELIIDSFQNFSAEMLKPVFDIVWNSFGYERSFNFDENGKWLKG
jgi:Putative DNA-binding domain